MIHSLFIEFVESFFRLLQIFFDLIKKRILNYTDLKLKSEMLGKLHPFRLAVVISVASANFEPTKTLGKKKGS
jgi:hypothetical protein